MPQAHLLKLWRQRCWLTASSPPLQVLELQHVLEHQGLAALEAFTPAALSWREVQALVGQHTVGLPLGFQAAQPAPTQSNTGVQTIQAALEEGARLTAAEDAGGCLADDAVALQAPAREAHILGARLH